ncbi:MAG: response regulator [Bacteroidia bacterium]|nr:response regulator [Bacteroidia bacterium]
MIRILVVEDEPDMQAVIRQRFRRQIHAGAYDIIFATDGVEALEILDQRGEIDLVLTDINMNRMDGLTLLSHIRERSKTLQVVIISAYSDMAHIRTAMNRGAFDFLVKPIDFQDLQATIDRTADHVQQLRVVHEQLKRVETLKDQFLANTSHELRTPLLGIIGLAEAMQARLQYPENQEDIAMIISSGQRLARLVDDILDFSRIRQADLTLQPMPVHLHSMADVVLKNFYPMVKGKPLNLVNAIPEDISAAFADENRLMQVFFNLVGNAVKFTETGHITVAARELEGVLEVTVTDTGIGIPFEKQAAIFEEFVQGEASVTRIFVGTGLGLSITRKLIELHGGKIWVQSAPGQGATFTFTLPVSAEVARITPYKHLARIQPALTETILPSPVSDPGTSARDVHILIVDDEAINQRVLSNHLASQGYRLSQALNGEEALRILDTDTSIDLVLLDVMMPRMSGYEVCEKIRQRYLPAELPVIMVTAKNQVQDLVQGFALGANDYIAKPFSREEFLARVNTQLDLHRIFEVAGRFVPNEFIRALGRDSITEVGLGDQAEREITVLFSDIRDYTTLSESMTPEQNFRFINAFHGRMGPVIHSNQGFINQYLGDGIMALFPRTAEDALKSAIQMQTHLRHYNQLRQTRDRIGIRIGIGLHTGPLIMGIIGDERRLDAATISDTVNTTSRIESLTKFFGVDILLSENSYLLLPDPHAYHIRYIGPIQVKGRQKAVKIYECFDSAPPHTADQKLKTRSLFEQAVHLYFGQDFKGAQAMLTDVLRIHPEDLTAQAFLRLAAQSQNLGMVLSTS